LFDKDVLTDKLKLEAKYSKIRNRAIEYGLEDFFETVFYKKIMKQVTLDQLYIFIIELLNNKYI